MSILNMNIRRSNQVERSQIGASSYKRPDDIYTKQTYDNYYGKASVPKQSRLGASTPASFNPTSSSQKQSSYLPKISREGDRKQLERSRLLISREKKRTDGYGIATSDSKKLTQSIKSQTKPRQSQKYLGGYLSSMPEEKETVLYQSRKQMDSIFRPKTLGLVGLNNIGNTCFMNSILQCMLNLPYFNDYFLANRHDKQIHSNGRVALAYGKLVQLIKNSTSSSQTPSEIKAAVASRKNIFSGYGQQDAQQFLSALLEHMSQDLNRSKKPKYKELKADLTKQSLKQISEQWWQYNLERQNSIVCDYFTGQLLSKVICSQCKNSSIAFDNTWDFSLNFSYGDGGDIVKMIQNFLKEENLSHDYYCSKCKASRDCTRKFYLYRLPQIIVFQIKRFSYGKYSKSKLNNRIKVPLSLNLTKVVAESDHHTVKSPHYNLVGVVNHSGQINYGHYTAQCKNSINGKWYNFNDSYVSETHMGQYFESSSPYLLFYCKQHMSAHI